MDAPSPENNFLAAHVAPLLQSFYELTGRHLIKPCGDPVEMARQVNNAPFFLASHDGGEDPILTYGNLKALELFEMEWEEFVRTPSRFTAEEPSRDERQRLLRNVSEKGFINDYSGIRISAAGQRFRIQKATVWNVSGGQAATFSEWEYL
jgi:hypothetical protein